jgi:hypothetical protein
MALHRRAPRRDSNEADIREALEAAGATWQALSIKGGPDALVGYQGRSCLIEVKQAKGKLRETQTAWHQKWRGSPVQVLRTPDEALALLRQLTAPDRARRTPEEAVALVRRLREGGEDRSRGTRLLEAACGEPAS